MPAALLGDGDGGRESCLRLILFLNIGNRETRVDRLDPESPIGTSTLQGDSQLQQPGCRRR